MINYVLIFGGGGGLYAALYGISLRNRNLVFMLWLGWTNFYGKRVENDEDNGRMCPHRMEECFNLANITHAYCSMTNDGIRILILIY